MNYVLDISLSGLLILGFAIGYKKGLIKSIWKVGAMVVTVILVMVMKDPAVEFVSGTQISARIYDSVASKIHVPQGGGVNLTQALHLPSFMQPQVDAAAQGAENAAQMANNALIMSLTKLIILIGVCVLLFVIIRLLLWCVYLILDKASKAPVLKFANRMSGGLFGLINIIFIVLLLLALFAMFAPAGSAMYDAINETYVVKYFYNYNILLQLFLK